MIINSWDWLETFIKEEDKRKRFKLIDSFCKSLGIKSNEIIFSETLGSMNANSSVVRLEKTFNKVKALNLWYKFDLIFADVQKALGKFKGRLLILLMDNKSINTKTMYGVAGQTLDDLVIVYVYPYNNNKWIEKFEELCFHELFHASRNRYFNGLENYDLFDVLLDEGLAESFVAQILGYNRIGDWAKVNQKMVKEFLPLYLDNLNITDPIKISHFMMGNKSLNIPYWMGYSVGYFIVQQYIKKNNIQNVSDYKSLSKEELGIFYRKLIT